MTFGSLRRCDRAEAEVVLASGVYITFRLETWKAPGQQNLVEVLRTRKGAARGDSILVDARELQAARHEAFRAIMAHRATMLLPPPPVELRFRPRQLSFSF
jgi:hypothetical protein